MAPTEPRTQESLFGAHICKSPCQRRQNAKVFSIRNRCTVGQYELDMLNNLAHGNDAAHLRKRMAWCNHRHERHFEQRLASQGIRDGRERTDHPEATTTVQHRLNDASERFYIKT